MDEPYPCQLGHFAKMWWKSVRGARGGAAFIFLGACRSGRRGPGAALPQLDRASHGLARVAKRGSSQTCSRHNDAVVREMADLDENEQGRTHPETTP